MKKSQRLKVIVDLNAENEKKALHELGMAQTKKGELEKQLENLEQYRQEYKDQYQGISEAGVNIAKLLEFRSFISKLDKVIEDQEKAISTMDGKLINIRKSWERQHQKTKSLQKVCDAATAEEVKKENKREQNEQDDRATRSGRYGGTRSA
jgi:flagellar FliJ protein